MNTIQFPKFSGKRCLMMPFIQGEPDSVPEEYRTGYEEILANTYLEKGDIGYLTIDESPVRKGSAQRAYRAKHGRAIHTEVGRRPNKIYAWGGGTWAGRDEVELDKNVRILLANNIDNSCALWDCEHENTTLDGDIGAFSQQYPYSKATFMKAGEVHEIGILTPHESLPVQSNANRQFIRIISSGVYGTEPYFTKNTLLN